MMKKVRWGILSTASIGLRRVVPAIQKSNNGEVVAVASRSLEKAQQFAAASGIPTAYGSYEELLADPNVDAIYNPLPNSEHAAWSIHCAEAGKPVLCEKPLASDAAEAQTMVDAFTSRNLLFAEGFMYRFHPQTVEIKKMVDSGAVGQIIALNATFTFALWNDNNIRLDAVLAGGGLMDVGCYCINSMRLMTGQEPIAGKALAHVGASGVDEWLSAVLAFPNGAIGHFDCGVRAQRTHTYEIRGTKGRIVAEQAFVPEPHEQPIVRWWQEDKYHHITMPAANQYTLMTEDFSDALLNNRPPRYNGQDGVANMQVIDRLLADARR